MNLKDKLLSSFLVFENQVDVDTPVHEQRVNAIKKFETLGFPTKKDESWKYTSLKSVLKVEFSLFTKTESTLEYKDVEPYLINEIESFKLVFINGKFSSHLSEATHDGKDICILSSALSKEGYTEKIKKYFNTIVPEESMSALNTAFSSEGAYIFIPKNTVVEKPIQIVNFTTGENESLFSQPRNLIVVEANAQVQIIERFQSLTSNNVLTNSVTEIFAEDNAIVDWYKIQNDNETASLVDNTYINQKKTSNCSVHTFSFGGKLVRNNLNFFQNGEGIDSTLKGVTIIGDKQHVDHNTLVHHIEPNCESHQDYKGIYSDSSTGVFNGKVVVEKEAQKTNAFQANNNILLTDKASVNTKPQLEIFADDVKCSHGCTIGQLDESALFYMQSRGIPKKEAKALMMYAFANNVLESVKIPELKNRIKRLIAGKLGVNLDFDL